VSDLAAPVTAWRGADDGSSPLVVLLHGRGSDESEILSIVDHLPLGPTYVALRAPIAEGAGYAWFANRGIGRPLPDSLAETMAWCRRWLDEVAPRPREVVLVGFSGGAAFAGGLLLDDPQRFSATALLYGTLPFDAGIPVDPGRLTGTGVLLIHGVEDAVIPAELLARTWQYLTESSGASLTASLEPGGHGLSAASLELLGDWLAKRLAPGDS
jgi:phospholipase/carboxylesterase